MNRIVISCALAATASISFGQAGVIKSLQGDYDKLSAAFAKNDVAVMDSYLSKDYFLIQPGGGRWDRAKVMADFKRQMANMKEPKWVRTVKSVKVSGDTVVADVAGTFHGKFKMQDGSTHVFDLVSATTDTWTLKPKHQLVKSQIGKLDAKIDGKAPGM